MRLDDFLAGVMPTVGEHCQHERACLEWADHICADDTSRCLHHCICHGDGPGAVVTGDTITRLLWAQLDQRYRTGAHDFTVNGQPGIRVTPHRMRVLATDRDGSWRIDEIGLIGHPVQGSSGPGVERQRTYRDDTAPTWAADLARHLTG